MASFIKLNVCHAAVGNGGSTDKFVWTQTLSELTVNVPVPAGTKTKMLDISFTNTKLKVRSVHRHLPGCF